MYLCRTLTSIKTVAGVYTVHTKSLETELQKLFSSMLLLHIHLCQN